MLYNSITALVGNTPLLRADNLKSALSLYADIFLKLEGHNPAGSAKDRVALSMIRAAEQSGELKKGGTIIEPTSGNTGIGLAAYGVALGYRVIIVMPESMSEERKKLISAYGAELVLTDASLGMSGAIKRAEELKNATDNSIIAGQFINPANPQVHYETTGPEIYRDTNGEVDVFVAGVGTGGTISGVGKYLKEQNKDIEIVAVEPSDSPLLSKGVSGPHAIQGIGANFVPDVLDTKIYDKILTSDTSHAFSAAKALCKYEGVLCGISGGAALSAAIDLAKREEYEGKKIVVLLADSGERYLSTALFGE